MKQFHPRIHIARQEVYTQSDDKQVQSKVDELDQDIDIVYLPGYSQDGNTVLKEIKRLIDEKKVATTIKVVGGDGLSYIKDYPYPAYPPKVADNILYYTSFTSPVSNCESHISQNDFYDHYRGIFGICPGNDALLAYDAARTMFWAIRQQPQVDDVASKILSIRHNLWSTLKGINKLRPLLFPDRDIITGPITFQSGERIDEIIQFFFIGPDGKIHLLPNETP